MKQFLKPPTKKLKMKIISNLIILSILMIYIVYAQNKCNNLHLWDYQNSGQSNSIGPRDLDVAWNVYFSQLHYNPNYPLSPPLLNGTHVLLASIEDNVAHISILSSEGDIVSQFNTTQLNQNDFLYFFNGTFVYGYTNNTICKLNADDLSTVRCINQKNNATMPVYSFTVFNGIVILGYTNQVDNQLERIVAYDLNDGEEKWSIPFQCRLSIEGEFAVSNDGQLLFFCNQTLHSLSVSTGKFLWNKEIKIDALELVTSDSGLLIVRGKNSICAMNITNQQIVWKVHINVSSIDYFYVAALSDKYVFVYNKNDIVALDLSSGKTIKTVEVPTLYFIQLDCENYVYYATHNGSTILSPDLDLVAHSSNVYVSSRIVKGKQFAFTNFDNKEGITVL